MTHNATGTPIVNVLFEFDLVFSIDATGQPVFTLCQGNKEITDPIVIESHMATLVFNLSAPGLTGVSWASNFQWIDPQSYAPTSKPTNLAFVRDNDSVVTMIDSNPITEGSDQQQMHFLFSVVKTNGLSATMYTSTDPIIINKKPPV